MLQAIVKKGSVFAENIPAPVVSKGSLLIKVVHSCISAGTEMSGVQASRGSLIQKALHQPEKVLKVFNMLKDHGIAGVYEKIKGKLDAGMPTGYSVAGVVIGVGEGVSGFAVGDPVAAAGAGLAHHAEYVDVPENLVVRLSGDPDFQAASSVALGSIAMQGVRRADLKLGEFCVVTGAGILGLLALQMLKLSGVRVLAVDLDEKRLEIARELGAERTLNPQREDPVKAVDDFTGGHGADAVVFTAATANSEPLSQAFRMCKRKGKVVLVGTVGMTIRREDMYAKELDFLISTSYGPGRYDADYEQKGMKYPYAYVRWTETRNMAEYLRLVQTKALKLDKLIQGVYPIERATEAFESLTAAQPKPLMVLLDYGRPDMEKLGRLGTIDRKLVVRPGPAKKGVVNVALIGAGGFPTGMHLPNFQKMPDRYRLATVMDQAGTRAREVAFQFGAACATTDENDIFKDPAIDLVMICTRHDSHGELVLKALKAGKHVFVEKPLCTRPEELEALKAFYDSAAAPPVLMPGFNRRFSRYAQEIKKHTDRRANPLFVHYRMNAGYIPLDHWVHEHGGRIVGEACHIIDLMTFLTDSELDSVTVQSLTPANERLSGADNKSIALKYKDGSVATLEYFAVGNKGLAKEYMEVHFDEKTIVMNDYKELTGHGLTLAPIATPTSEKGHFEEMERLHRSLTGECKEWPIALWDMIQTTQATFAILT